MKPTSSEQKPRSGVDFTHRRRRFLGMDAQEWIKTYFGSNAWVAIIILSLITIFLFREAAGFFPENLRSMTIYREAGLEYVDSFRKVVTGHEALTRLLGEIQRAEQNKLKAAPDAPAPATPLDDSIARFTAAADPLNEKLTELIDTATALKERVVLAEEAKGQKAAFLGVGKQAEADAITVEEVDLEKETQYFRDSLAPCKQLLDTFKGEVEASAAAIPAPSDADAAANLARFRSGIADFLPSIETQYQLMAAWDFKKPVPFTESITAFLFGRDWITNSSWQDFFGILPLFAGSFVISLIALAIAVPFGIGAAIFVNKVAGPRERDIIKPTIEFISAIPSVVLGFFGVVILGEGLFFLANQCGLKPESPLNMFTAGCLLAFMSVPTIFTLSEDAINNVPKSFHEASLALGATRFQTIVRIIVPTALSGIIAAVMLGFGRVIGETMVVLLVAGNRIKIPDFSTGLSALFQPAHTMTGIIAQELGEVGPGSLHYRSLFMVGLVLFFVSLAINAFAQQIIRKYKLSVS